MTSSALQDRFNNDGYAIVPNVLSAEQVSALRGELTRIFDHGASLEGDFDRRGRLGSVRQDVIARNPSLHWLLAHPPLLAPLRELLGDDFVFLPEMSAHRGGYGDWHKDTTSQERAGEQFQWSSDYLMVEAALYLQANTAAYGGGLNVVPGSHRSPDRFLNVIDRTFADKVRTKLKSWQVLPTEQGTAVPSQAGDLTLFHFRTDHRASPAKTTPVPAEHEKLALFMACSRRNAHAAHYIDYLKRRPDYLFLKEPYPESLTGLAEKNGLSLPR